MRVSVASARAMTRSPPTTRLSLLASASSMPSPSAATVGPRPAEPTRAFRTRSASESVISSTRPSAPPSTRPPVHSAARAAASGSARATVSTPNWRACSRSRSALPPAASPTTSSESLRETTSRACVPIEPVEPTIRILRIRRSVGASESGSGCPARPRGRTARGCAARSPAGRPRPSAARTSSSPKALVSSSSMSSTPHRRPPAQSGMHTSERTARVPSVGR